MKTNEWHIIGRGWNGWHAKGVDVSGSGGSLESFVKDAIEGAVVYDADQADRKAFAALIISGPIVEPRLGLADTKPFTDRATAANLAQFLEGSFQTIALLAAGQTYRGLDEVGVDVYAGLLARVPGIKLGRVIGGQVVWAEKPAPVPQPVQQTIF